MHLVSENENITLKNIWLLILHPFINNICITTLQTGIFKTKLTNIKIGIFKNGTKLHKIVSLCSSKS